MSIPAPFAKIVISQLIMNGTESIRMVGRRPTFSANTPTGRALIAAAMARIADTREPVERERNQSHYTFTQIHLDSRYKIILNILDFKNIA